MKTYKYTSGMIPGIIGVMVCLYLYVGISDFFIPRFYDDTWKITSTYEGFYELEPESLDVIFLGSSKGSTAFDPAVLQERYGLSSYNLSCEQQSMLISYYWLMEALKTQTPGVVVLDVDMLYPNVDHSLLNSEESFVRAAMDSMKWSENKLSAVREICALDGQHSFLGYLLPLYRYHDRWRDPEDLFGNVREGIAPDYSTRGFVSLGSEGDNHDYKPLEPHGSEHYVEMLPVMRQYADRIAEQCRARGIHLLLVNTPTSAFNHGLYNSLSGYASDQGLVYIDFNEYRFYHASKYRYHRDNAENSHANHRGAAKITDFIGQVLQQVYFM